MITYFWFLCFWLKGPRTSFSSLLLTDRGYLGFIWFLCVEFDWILLLFHDSNGIELELKIETWWMCGGFWLSLNNLGIWVCRGFYLRRWTLSREGSPYWGQSRLQCYPLQRFSQYAFWDFSWLPSMLTFCLPMEGSF